MLDTLRSAFAASAQDLPGVELVPQRLASACAEVLPIAGAGMSLYFASGRRLPLGASNDAAGRAERLQFTVGEGPCLAAHAEQRPVVADEAELSARWPTFAAELAAQTDIRGIVALPLSGELAQVGVLDLYVASPHHVTDLSLADALAVTEEVTRVFQQTTNGGPRPTTGPAWLDAPAAQRRATVWQAMGFLNFSLQIDSVDALAVLRGYAYTQGTDVDTVAGQVLDGSLPVAQLAPGADAC